MSKASSSDVAVRLGRALTVAEVAQVEALIEDVESMILARYSDLTVLNERTLIAVESYAVMRVLRNPDGKRQQSIDDYSWTTDTALSSGALYISDIEWDQLAPDLAAASGAFSIRPSYDC